MSIIQDALKKAQSNFTVKEAPQGKSHAAQAETVKKEPAQAHIQPHDRQEQRSSPSMLLPALVSVLTILLLAYGFRASLQYARKHDNTKGAQKNISEAVADKKIEAGAAPANIFGQANKLNPINFMGPRQSLFVLNGIMYVENRPQAIINGQVLEEGDKISGATVLMIEKDCVLLDLNDTNIRIEMNKEN